MAARGRGRGGEQRVRFVIVRAFDDLSQPPRDQFGQRLAHEARFARARDAGDRRQAAERERDVQPVQIVARDIGEPQPAGRVARYAIDLRGRSKQMAARL